MKKVNVYRNGNLTNVLPYNTTKDEERFQKHIVMGTFGKDAHTIDGELISEEVVDSETGEVITPAAYEQIEVPAEFTYEIVDETALCQQRLINEESLKFLQETDWYVVRNQETGKPIPEEILQARQAARDSVQEI